MIRDIRKIIEPETGWRLAKKFGKTVVPAGAPTIAVEALLRRLKEIGIFVVPSGEVESFVRSVPGKGPQWAIDIIQRGAVKTATEAHIFVREVLDSF